VSWVRTARRRAEIDRRIRDSIATGVRDFARVEAAVRYLTLRDKNDVELKGLVRERLQRYLEDESELQVEAEDEVMRHLEPLPRHAKRLLNRLRLLLFVAHERKMFGGEPALTPRHVGKWAVLCERWPGLAVLVSEDPSIIHGLEDFDRFNFAVAKLGSPYTNDKGLRPFFLENGTVRLSPVIERIVEFRPANEKI